METGTDRPLRFGVFELDVQSRELRKGTTCVRLQEQPFEILCLMLERPGHVVTRDELRQRLWPDGTFVDFEHSLNAAVKRLRAALGDDADNPRYVETLPRRGYRFIGPVDLEKTPAAAAPVHTQRVRIAVLPFTSLGEDIGQEYFNDGLTEEMIAQLGRLCRGRIGIIARQSSMAFKGTTHGARDIGHALRADYLLEGSVRREGDRVRIIARLIETDGETHLWVETYERHLTDCLSVQAEVSQRIAHSLAMELVPDQRVDREMRSPDASAYQAYLQGRYFWNKTGNEGFDEAAGFFEDAIRIDPSYAAAHSALARVHIGRAEYYHERPRAALEKARAAAERALQLDPLLAEGHLTVGEVRRTLQWDTRAARSAYMQAIALNPSYESAHRAYAVMLTSLARHSQAIGEADRACELDPLCLYVTMTAAWVRYAAGDYAAAIEYCRRTIGMDGRYFSARRLLGAACLQARDERAALQALEEAVALADHDVVAIAWLAHVRAAIGDRAAAAGLLTRLERLARQRYVPAFHLALVHAGFGDRDAAFDALERAADDRDPALANVAVDPRFATVRSDPRYAELLTRLGL
jgi:TolB-like protein/Tfp pilus assembly protein PilF